MYSIRVAHGHHIIDKLGTTMSVWCNPAKPECIKENHFGKLYLSNKNFLFVFTLKLLSLRKKK